MLPEWCSDSLRPGGGRGVAGGWAIPASFLLPLETAEYGGWATNSVRLSGFQSSFHHPLAV